MKNLHKSQSSRNLKRLSLSLLRESSLIMNLQVRNQISRPQLSSRRFLWWSSVQRKRLRKIQIKCKRPASNTLFHFKRFLKKRIRRIKKIRVMVQPTIKASWGFRREFRIKDPKIWDLVSSIALFHQTKESQLHLQLMHLLKRSSKRFKRSRKSQKSRRLFRSQSSFSSQFWWSQQIKMLRSTQTSKVRL